MATKSSVEEGGGGGGGRERGAWETCGSDRVRGQPLTEEGKEKGGEEEGGREEVRITWRDGRPYRPYVVKHSKCFHCLLIGY